MQGKTENTAIMYRQGDWLMVKVDTPDLSDATKEKRDNRNRLIIGEGESTGHAHAVVETGADIYMLNGVRWLVADEPITVIHEEHGSIPLDMGTWKLIGQRQYDTASGLIQQVRD